MRPEASEIALHFRFLGLTGRSWRRLIPLKLTVVEAEPIRGRILPAAQSAREFVVAGSIFRTSLADLATLTQNTVKRAVAASMAFLASPTHIQQRGLMCSASNHEHGQFSIKQSRKSNYLCRRCGKVWPGLLATARPYFSNWTISARPDPTAMSIAVSRFLFLRLRSAPAFRSALTTSACPSWEPTMSAL